MIIENVRNNYYKDYSPSIKTLPHMPTGPLNRIADNTRAEKLLGDWRQMSFKEGLQRTINWYFATKKHEHVEEIFSKNKLTERL
jgi:nucleoside-diphosphate-sugar epimerase